MLDPAPEPSSSPVSHPCQSNYFYWCFVTLLLFSFASLFSQEFLHYYRKPVIMAVLVLISRNSFVFSFCVLRVSCLTCCVLIRSALFCAKSYLSHGYRKEYNLTMVFKLLNALLFNSAT